ncbi:MFS transporter [Caulobacter vibrioides]|uniref:Major facilitator family transporter n=2 Tax=Caulobacter vibrioides TaxID=155892 RepID=Q9AC41_CAUVC|nr:MFS transporter [Caulobacter vibrioides]YP_002515400.1 major facilitator superfamily transporter [Caulobacter vibrioides NA1000]AAK22013.1 major facilitator family transporter [Caulobacter vibrioides CB15]ACL93492.1 major facilitator superfamily transporter [Caulobacter vibrioides NA1000]ATC26862.1 MFS transporter [Caulobacter vibrioides]QXZ52121.1 MHS family MFS transporter [Caulobacter vibrioides]
MAEEGQKRASMRTVVSASSAGTAFEWYDFFIFGSLTQVISKTFFAGLNETAGYIAALALFGVGFAFRPLGALVFGKIGDQDGRKGAFLATVLLMGGATFAIAFLPTYEQAGIIAPILLIILRCLQGFALGGEYGGAAIYVAEHSPANKRGWATSWVQTSAAFGLFGALLVILATRWVLGKYVGPDAFDEWGWRIPFAVSLGLLGISVWMRLKLTESPTFEAMKAEGQASKAPYAEAFGQWSNLKLVILAFVSMMCAQGAVWYTSFFYVQTFMEKFLKVDPVTINELMMIATAVSAIFYVVFGWLSDKVGRKPVMLGGMTLALLFYFPGFHLLEKAANPALAEASAKAPVVVFADPKDCSLQFDPVGKTAFVTSCDIVKSTLANAGVSYANEAAPAGAVAVMRIGGAEVLSKSAAGLGKDEVKATKAEVEGRIKAALAGAGYPTKADPARMNMPMILGVLFVFVIAATALFGPLAACLVELFPTRVRYTALSLPYHIGTGWVGGFVPFFAFAIVAAVGNIYAGLWYPFAFTLLSVLTTLFLLPETKERPLN